MCGNRPELSKPAGIALSLAVLLVLSFCRPIPGELSPASTASAESPAVTITPTESLQPSATATPEPPAPSPTSTASSTSVPFQVCSPLQGYDLAQIVAPDMLKTLYEPPIRGHDDGHFGIDLSYWSDQQGRPMEGLPVMAVLPGKVASLIADREPYGNMVMIETPLEDLPDWLRDVIPLPAEADVQPAGLLCDPFPPRDSMDSLSLYTVYAHLRDTPQLRPDQTVGCGEQIGAVGTTGRSVNAHLHLEMRSGPSGTRFASMAHYDNSTSEQERLNYCIWRVSGRFQSFDPLLVIKGFEAQRLP